MDLGLGDYTRPRHFCRACGHVEYVPMNTRAYFPPKVSEGRIKKAHKISGCRGEIEYRAGVDPHLIAAIQRAEKKEKPDAPQ